MWLWMLFTGGVFFCLFIWCLFFWVLSDWSKLSISHSQGSSKLTLQPQWIIIQCERAQKLCQTIVSKVEYMFLQGTFALWKIFRQTIFRNKSYRVFHTQSGLNKHLTVQHGKPPGKRREGFNCDSCCRTFRMERTLIEHKCHQLSWSDFYFSRNKTVTVIRTTIWYSLEVLVLIHVLVHLCLFQK